MKKKETAKTTEVVEAPKASKQTDKPKQKKGVSPKTKSKPNKVQDEEELPIWDLESSYYSGITDPAISTAKENILKNVQMLAEDKDEIPKMREYDMLAFIRRYEKVIDDIQSLYRFASLTACTDRKSTEKQLFEKQIGEFVDSVAQKIGWVHNTLYSLSWDKKVDLLESAKFKDYQEWLMCNLLLPPALHEATRKAVGKMSTLTNGWHSLYHQLTSKMSFVLDGKNHSLDEIEEVAFSDESKETRDKALKVLSDEFKKYGYIFTQTLNSILKNEDVTTQIYMDGDNESISRVYEYDSLDADGFANGLNREQILAVATAVTDSYVPISQRFFKLLAQLQGRETINYNDRCINPVPSDNKEIPWSECLQFVCNALMAFNPAMAMSGINVINANMIHARPMDGKDVGAFCVQGAKPFIFLNYKKNVESMLTFAHEFGHAVHHLYSIENAGLLNDNTPISMAEVASTFNEKLILNQLLASDQLTEQERLHLLVYDVSRQISTIHRQIAFSKFELRAFRERQKGELSEERFTQIYCEEMERYLGFKLEDDAKFGWMAIPHVFNSPFYVRYYAFAGMVTNKLWQVFLSQEFEDDFPERYLNMLSNTGLEDIEDLLDHFELDPNTPDFWTSALDMISNEINMIEALAKKLELI